jgi:hypothetical protein
LPGGERVRIKQRTGEAVALFCRQVLGNQSRKRWEAKFRQRAGGGKRGTAHRAFSGHPGGLLSEKGQRLTADMPGHSR